MRLIPTPIQMGVSWAVVVACVLSGSAQQRTYVGAETCAKCHTDQYARQSTTRHARALHRALEHPLAESFVFDQQFLVREGSRTDPVCGSPGWIKFVRTNKELKVQAVDNCLVEQRMLELPVEWAFGAEDGVTFVSRLSEDFKETVARHLKGIYLHRFNQIRHNEIYIEHSLSYYRDIQSMALTLGHQTYQPSTLLLAMGDLYQGSDDGVKGAGTPGKVVQCFGCHSTGPLQRGPNQELQPTELGVRCEACHGPGSAHVEALGRGDVERARKLISLPNGLSGKRLIQTCAPCHRTGHDWNAENWNYVDNLRHQVAYFVRSKCFQKGSGAFSCVSCHDPHEPVRKNDPSHYNQRCLGCHGAEAHPAKSVSQGKLADHCITCHMPQVAMKMTEKAKRQLHNHWIGVYRNGEDMIPSR